MRRFVVAFAVILLLGGCNAPNPLVGTWSGTGTVLTGTQLASVVFQFHPDGIVEESIKSKKSIFGDSALFASDIASLHIAGRYAIKDDVLTITPMQFTGLDSDGKSPLFMPDFKHDPQLYRFDVKAHSLKLDGLDGSPPTMLTRQSK